MPRQRKPKIHIEMPQLAPHPCGPVCDCILARPYIRVSRVGNRQYLISPEIQLRAIEEWAKRNKRRLLEPACDINKSGRTFRKRSVDKILEEIRAGEHREVVLWKWSRWARNTKDSAVYLEKVYEAGGDVFSATEDMDPKTAVGRFTRTVTGAADEFQSDLISETWHAVHGLRRGDGLPHGGRERFGYDYIDAGEGVKRYVPNDEAEVLKQAYLTWLGWDESGRKKSFNKISEEFNRAGWLTTLGGSWTPQGVARMMDTGFAAGLIRERSAPNGEPANSIKSYDIWRKGTHEPIIEPEAWTEYYSRRVGSASLPSRSKKAAHGLSALLFCSVCRRRLSIKHGGADRPRTQQWQCPWHKSFHPDKKAVTVNNRLALEAVREWVRREFKDELPVGRFETEAMERISREKDQRSREQNAIRAEIRERERKIKNLVLQAEDEENVAAARRLNARVAELDKEVEELSAQLTPDSVKKVVQKDYEALRKLDEVWDELPPDVLRDFLGKLVSRIEVYPRTSTSTRTSAEDRVRPVGVWQEPALDDWLSDRRA